MVTARQLRETFGTMPPRSGKTKLSQMLMEMAVAEENVFSYREKELIEEDKVLTGGGKKMIKKYIDLDLLADLYGLKYDVLIGEYIKIKVKMNDSETASELYNTLKDGEVLLGYSNALDKNEVAIFKAETDSDVKFILREGQISIIANLKYLR